MGMRFADWYQFRQEWRHSPHAQDYHDVSADDPRKLLTWHAPNETLPPRIIEMILSLEERLERAEEKIKEMER
jgi:hypothetical protein